MRQPLVQPQQGLTSNTHSPFDSGSTGARKILDDGESGLVGDVINRLIEGAVTLKIADVLRSEVLQQLVEDQRPVGVGHALLVLAANVARHRINFLGPTFERIRGGMEARIQFGGLSPSDGATCCAFDFIGFRSLAKRSIRFLRSIR